jgi:hypothetical protein
MAAGVCDALAADVDGLLRAAEALLASAADAGALTA